MTTDEELDPIAVTEDFGEIYTLAKEWEDLRVKAQKTFFRLATQEKAKERLPQKVVDVPEDEDLLAWIGVHHPGWNIIDVNEDETKLILERDPSLMEYVFTNPNDGLVYKRSEVESGPQLDIDRLKEEDPDLYDEITTFPQPLWSILTEVTETLDPSFNVEHYLKCHPDVQKIPIDPEDWTTEQAARIKPYLLPGKISVKLTPPRKSKEEE